MLYFYRKGYRYRGKYQRGENKEEDKGGGGMCTGYGWIKEVPIKIKYVKKKEMGYFFLTHVCSEEEVGHKVNKPIFDLQKK